MNLKLVGTGLPRIQSTQKTNMTLENCHVQKEIHLKMVDILFPCQFSGGILNRILKNKKRMKFGEKNAYI